MARGGEIRVLTTVYAAATEQRALDALVDLGADVRVSYDTGATRLHAKAWLFERATGYSTAYVGSSNLSRSAQVDGLEWNVRLAESESPLLVDRFPDRLRVLLDVGDVRTVRARPVRARDSASASRSGR